MPRPNLTPEQIRWFRLRRSGLVEPFQEATEAASALVGVQAQILPAAGLSLWNRLPALTHEQYDSLLHDERLLVKLWGQRGTLHLYTSDEWPLLHGAFNHGQSWYERIARDSEQYRTIIARVEGMLRERGTLGRSDLRDADLPLEEWHLSAWGGIFAILVYRGVACHAPKEGGEGRFVHREQWLPALRWDPPPTEEANIEIARRYFATYGPATLKDFAYWRGANQATARPWLEALRPELAEVESGGETLLALREDLPLLEETPPPREEWPVRLLYRFDPLLLGLRDKGWIVAEEHYKKVWRPAGHIEGTILEQGNLRGTWRYDRRSGGLTITVRPFEPLPRHVREAVEAHAQGVAVFFNLPLSGLDVISPGAQADEA